MHLKSRYCMFGCTLSNTIQKNPVTKGYYTGDEFTVHNHSAE